MSGIQNFEAFVLASIMLNLIPGPDTFYILGRSMAQGKRTGIASALGISAGAVCHTLMAAVGLSALITASPVAFTAVKWAGAAYLVYMGIKMVFTRQSGLAGNGPLTEQSFAGVFQQGLITNALNPKVALFFLAFLPQFIAPDSTSHFTSFLLLGLTFVVTSSVYGLCLATASAFISKKLRENPAYLNYLNKFTGTLLVGLGVRLALDK